MDMGATGVMLAFGDDLDDDLDDDDDDDDDYGGGYYYDGHVGYDGL